MRMISAGGVPVKTIGRFGGGGRASIAPLQPGPAGSGTRPNGAAPRSPGGAPHPKDACAAEVGFPHRPSALPAYIEPTQKSVLLPLRKRHPSETAGEAVLGSPRSLVPSSSNVAPALTTHDGPALAK
jgi:hypothetical protein